MSCSPTERDAPWAARVVIWLASEDPRLPFPGLVSTVMDGRFVAPDVGSAVTDSVKPAGTTSAP